MIAATQPEPRAVNPLLMLGLIAFPVLFFWFLLIPGYAPSLRRIVAVYAFGPIVLAVVVALLSGLLDHA